MMRLIIWRIGVGVNVFDGPNMFGTIPRMRTDSVSNVDSAGLHAGQNRCIVDGVMARTSTKHHTSVKGAILPAKAKGTTIPRNATRDGSKLF
jgi:hypothetical protein